MPVGGSGRMAAAVAVAAAAVAVAGCMPRLAAADAAAPEGGISATQHIATAVPVGAVAAVPNRRGGVRMCAGRGVAQARQQRAGPPTVTPGCLRPHQQGLASAATCHVLRRAPHRRGRGCHSSSAHRPKLQRPIRYPRRWPQHSNEKRPRSAHHLPPRSREAAATAADSLNAGGCRRDNSPRREWRALWCPNPVLWEPVVW